MPERSSVIKSSLRRRIIMHSGNEDYVLYEGKLAQEFGVSRTPIRQVLQALESESLVEVRSGVGTIAPPLLMDRRERDLKAYSAILIACSNCAIPTGINAATLDLTTLRTHLEQSTDADQKDLFFDVCTKFIDVLSSLVDDRILRDALVACFWRYVRRRVVEHDGDISTARSELIKTIKDAEHGAQTNSPDQVFRMVGANVDLILRSPEA